MFKIIVLLLNFYLDPCDECVSNSTCQPQLDGSVNCVCPTGYGGINCNSYIELCDPNPCENGGSCEDLINDYICHCTSGHVGRNCSFEGFVYVCICYLCSCIVNYFCY